MHLYGPIGKQTYSSRLPEMKSIKLRTAAKVLGLLCVGAIFLSGCSTLKDTYYPPVYPTADYLDLYPHYVQLCAVSQIRAKFAETGGSPGHAVMYLGGACKDPSAKYPRLKLCDESSVYAGVGISVNKTLKNINWMAIPGRDLFFHGGLKPDETLTADRAREAIAFADASDVFAGIEIHEQYEPPKNDPQALELFIASETLGTDFALNFGRNTYCATLPLTEPMLKDIVDFLNDMNDKYARGEAKYNWSGYSDNCVHLLRNGLAAANVWRPKSVNQIKLLQLFNLAVPANELTDLAFRANNYLIEDFEMVYRDQAMREALKRYNWLPTRHGAVLTFEPVHQNNELYDTRYQIFVLEAPIFRPKSHKITKMYEQPRFTEIAANLKYFQSRYQQILADRPKDWDQAGPDADDYTRTRKLYYEYIQAQLDDVELKLKQLSATSKGN